MIGGDCTSFDEAVQRVRDWDEAFVEQIAKALDGETSANGRAEIAKAAETTEKGFRRGLREETGEIPRLGHDMCVFNSAQLAFVAKQRDLLLDLVLDYQCRKTRLQYGGIQRFQPSRHSSLSPDSRLSERPTANVIRMCSSTNTKTRPPRRRHC